MSPSFGQEPDKSFELKEIAILMLASVIGTIIALFPSNPANWAVRHLLRPVNIVMVWIGLHAVDRPPIPISGYSDGRATVLN